MKFQIGAMTVGDILDRGLKLLIARLPTFYLISLIVLAPVIFYLLMLPALMSAESGLGAVVGGGLVVWVLALILQQIGAAAILHVISQEFIDQRVGIGAAFGFALKRFGTLILASILTGLMIGFGLILCIVPGIIFWSWYALVAQVVVVEGLGANAALNRSKDLTAGFRGRVLGLLLLFIVIALIPTGAVQLLELVIPSTERVPIDQADAGFGLRGLAYTEVFNYRNYAINTVLGQLVNILVQTFQAVCLTLLYFDLRIRKEGFDLELAARQQAAGGLCTLIRGGAWHALAIHC
jgi:hypothetical protein